MFFGFISKKHLVVKFKFKGHCGSGGFTQMRNCPLKDIIGFRGSSWQTIAVSLAAAVFPSVRWSFAGTWPSVDWWSFDKWWGTGCSGAGHWSLRSSPSDTSEACGVAAPLDFCLDSAAAAKTCKAEAIIWSEIGDALWYFCCRCTCTIKPKAIVTHFQFCAYVELYAAVTRGERDTDVLLGFDADVEVGAQR